MSTDLAEIFESRRIEYKKKLSSISKNSLADLSIAITDTIYDEFMSYFEYSSTYRNELNNAENAMLTSMLQFISPQKDAVQILNGVKKDINCNTLDDTQNNIDGKLKWILALGASIGGGILKINPIIQIVGVAIGYAGGDFIEKSSQYNRQTHNGTNVSYFALNEDDISQIVEFTKDTLVKIDDSIDCFRVQLSNIKKDEVSKRKPFEIEYKGLLTKIQGILGSIKYSNQKIDDDVLFEINYLEKELSNLNIKTVYYLDSMTSEEISEFFDTIYNSTIDKVVPVYPAFIKKNYTILKGRIDCPV